MKSVATIIFAAVVACASASAQEVSINVKGRSGQDIRVGVFTNIRSDCTVGPPPTIRLVTPPVNGAVRVARGTITITNARGCLAVEAPGYIAFYKSKPNFSGQDRMALEVLIRDGRPQIRQYIISVGGAETSVPL
jgi:hypothetical protein